ncbi:MAG: hypothetical protein KA314_23805 [Chloroflexi bacterium]|nr:hypothetical protein [Chloroflexota bacterium]MBP8058870.1 hypothetical protein [Chloroflexota bacterium]
MPKKRTLFALVLSILILIIGSALALDAYRYYLEALLDVRVNRAETIGADLHQVLRQGMSDNNHAGVRRAVSDTVGTYNVVQVRILGLNGKVYADSHGELQGAFLDKTLPGCIECHRDNPLPTLATLNFLPDRIRVATPIANDTTCMSCHNIPGTTSLGVILVDISLAASRAEARERLFLQLGGTVLLSLVVGLLVVGSSLLGWRPPSPLLRLPQLWARPRSTLTSVVLVILGGIILITFTGTSVAATLEEKDSFCISCHTEPETTYYERTLAEPVDLASAHAHEDVGCIDCHSGAGVVGRVDAMSLGAKNVALYLTGNYQTPTQAETTIHTDHCTKCHADVLTEDGMINHFHTFTPQWGEPTACVTCHPAHPTDGSPEASYTQDTVVQPVCAECHALASQQVNAED